jgi:hypothetical protein
MRVTDRQGFIAEITASMKQTAKKKGGIRDLTAHLEDLQLELVELEAKKEKQKNPEYRELMGIESDNDSLVTTVRDDIDVNKMFIAALKKVISESRK